MTSRQASIDRNARHCAERGILLPTYAQMQGPEKIPRELRERLLQVDLHALDPLNLFRIGWKNEPPPQHGFGAINGLELPSALTGVKARIIGLLGKQFPTGAHKVGPAYSCLVPHLIDGSFDPSRSKAAWPSTGNYCRGGAFVSRLLGCDAVAILPAGMSRERFDWLEMIGAEIIRTPGCESNVKEIFDTCLELRRTRPEVHIFDQFSDLSNTRWHYNVTGPAMAELFDGLGSGHRLAACVFASGSAGTLGAGYYLKDRWPQARLAVAEALQCPTLLNNGFGDHGIEGIGDKHVPLVHDLKRTDMVVAIDEQAVFRPARLFWEPAGRAYLMERGVPAETAERLAWMGISSVANLLAAIKVAKYYELDERDVIFTSFTDGMELYNSRLDEMRVGAGEYGVGQAQLAAELLKSTAIDYVRELGYYDRKRIHNLKYFTWVEQQGRSAQELHEQWYDHERYWSEHLDATALDEQITAFNDRIKHYSP